MIGDYRNLYGKWNLDNIVEILITPNFKDNDYLNDGNKETYNKSLENLDILSKKYDEKLSENLKEILEINYEDPQKTLESILEIISEYSNNQKRLWIKYTILCVKKIIHIFI